MATSAWRTVILRRELAWRRPEVRMARFSVSLHTGESRRTNMDAQSFFTRGGDRGGEGGRERGGEGMEGGEEKRWKVILT